MRRNTQKKKKNEQNEKKNEEFKMFEQFQWIRERKNNSEKK